MEQVGEAEGLGLLPLVTHFEARKITRRVKAQVIGAQTLFGADLRAAAPFDAYEIHMGRSTSTERGQAPLFALECTGPLHDGSCSSDGLVVGTYLHGALRACAVASRDAHPARCAGVELPASGAATSVDDALDRLATVVCSNLDMDAVFDMMGLRGTTT